MTQTLSQIYLMLNGNKPLNIGMLTANAASTKKKVEFTPGAKMPASIISNMIMKQNDIRFDSDKSFDTETDCPDSTILSSLGHVLEKFFVLPYEEFAKTVEEEREFTRSIEAETTGGTNLLMTRSQLGLLSSLFARNGTFDIKTRATIAIRHDPVEPCPFLEIPDKWMDVLSHTTIPNASSDSNIFQSLRWIKPLFGNSQEGDKVFKLCLGYMERILEDATLAYPETVTFELLLLPKATEIYSLRSLTLTLSPSHQARIVRGGGLEDKEFGVVSSEEDREKIDWSIFCQTFKYPRSEELDQLYRSIRRSKTANELQESPSSTSDDDLSPSSSSSPLGIITQDTDKPGLSYSHFRPHTGNLIQETEVSKLVKHLRSIAKDGWKFQHQPRRGSERQKVISLKPAEFSIQDRQPSLSNRLPSTSPPSSSSTSSASHSNSDWQNHLIAQERLA
ncbi:hypothetical protein PGT21_025770 [Puccinia graminis f. sp. tritici]|uniref:Uncharacterized protein n=1 Tax=Puccinia graminis f. sp. tritici TaxID=56615 RepID=A0A5B0QJ78_PUCGR|nr:hypothetical protein PGT21_025770 [Puccinia graminis f. sp. tritici]